MTDRINQNQQPPTIPVAGPAGGGGPAGSNAPASERGGAATEEQQNALRLQLVLLKKTPGVPPEVNRNLEKQLEQLKAGDATHDEVQQAFDKAKEDAMNDSVTQMTYTIIGTVAGEMAKQVHNPLLEEIKKNSKD